MLFTKKQTNHHPGARPRSNSISSRSTHQRSHHNQDGHHHHSTESDGQDLSQ